MDTRAQIEQWARQAVAPAIHECLLATSCQLRNAADNVAGEAIWRHPGDEAWMEWRARRKMRDDPKRAPDSTR